ncbi:hypothetical protein LCGC14_0641440 [marine sediment metagenome]|uniref:Uncharacterized protein n=1 Tax=marine sediment metagenome TaxID=412755 RepID=A0A0F9R466_9ZZZZ|nr:hypothetical protein [archaeon]HEC36775.1 hypothetical protein [bacterium]
MTTKIKIINKKEDEAFYKVAKSIADFMELKGWKVLIIAGIRVQKQPLSLKYNYELIIKFTGKKILKKIN